MAYTKYSLTPANNTAAPPDGAPEGMLPSAVNDTMRDMMAQIRDCGDGIRDGTYTMTAPKITGGTITGSTINNSAIGATTASTGAFSTLSATGNVSFDGGSFVFNESGADKDARFEGDTDANLLFLDASTDRIGIGTNSPSVKLQVNGATTIDGTIIQNAALFQMNGSGNADLRLVNTAGTTGRRAFDWLSNGDNLRSRLLSDDGSSLITDNLLVINWNGNVGIGTSSPVGKLSVYGSGALATFQNSTTGSSGADGSYIALNGNDLQISNKESANMIFYTVDTERMRITSGGDVCIGKTSSDTSTLGGQFTNSGSGFFYFNVTNTTSSSGQSAVYINRHVSDGELITFRQADISEGNISVSGTTVSYNGGHLSRWSQLPDGSKDDTLLKGTILSNIDDMCVWVKDGETLPNEQLNKMKVSDVEGDTNVAGVFVNWTFDEQCQSDDMNVAMTGDMIIRIAEGVVVQRGDLLMSAGDGTAKPQGDDIVRSKTIAKVTSNHVTCTYADGSYCVPCVLMAC